jgi:hypothetical protein
MLHEYRQLHAAAGGQIGETGEHYEALVPHKMQLWLYGLGLDRGHYDAIVDRLVIAPMVGLSAVLNRIEPTWMGGSSPAKASKSEAEEEAGDLVTENSHDSPV